MHISIELSDPSCIKDLQSFLGFVNQLGKFSPTISSLLSHWERYWAKKIGHGISMTHATKDVKSELYKAPCLGLYDAQKSIIIMSDTPTQGLGCVLFQVQSDGSRCLKVKKSN